jgi:basic membrane protein A
MKTKSVIRLYSTVLIIAMLMMALSGCVEPTPEAEVPPAGEVEAPSGEEVEEPPAEEAEPPPTEEPKLKAALITPSPLGDQGFIDLQAAGFEMALADLPIEGKVVQTKGAEEHEAALRGAAAEGFDLIILASMNPDMVISVATDFPDVHFSAIDMFFMEGTPDNLGSVLIELPETEFLAGVIAGTLTETNILGAVVAVPGEQFDSATVLPFEAGAQTVNPDVEVLRGVSGSFTDPAAAKELALSQIEQGADILFHAAGQSGLGVIEAAQENGVLAIGLENNQDDVAPGTVIASAMRRLDLLVVRFIEEELAGEFVPGSRFSPLREGLTGLSWEYGSDTFETNAPSELADRVPELKELVEKYRDEILNCGVVVPGAFVSSCQQ